MKICRHLRQSDVKDICTRNGGQLFYLLLWFTVFMDFVWLKYSKSLICSWKRINLSHSLKNVCYCDVTFEWHFLMPHKISRLYSIASKGIFPSKFYLFICYRLKH